MKEKAWIESQNPAEMLAFLTADEESRKLRLFGCACCRRIWSSLPGPTEQRAVEVAECSADDPMYIAERDSLDEQLQDNYLALEGTQAATPVLAVTSVVQRNAMHCAFAADAAAAVNPASAVAESAFQAVLVRDIFGNPFRPVEFAPEWRTSAAVGLARTMYDARDFAAMPVLADALEEAGCGHPDVLSHCRGPGPHVRGCWVVDGVLGKT